MKTENKYVFLFLIVSALIVLEFGTADAQQDLAQQAYAIMQQNCLDCHGPHGFFIEQLIIESAPGLIATGTVVPGNPDESELYKRLLGPTTNGAQMPFNQPPLSQAAISTLRQWIQAGAPGWETQHDPDFITTDTMLTAMQRHLSTLDPFSRPFARYFTTTHLYNAGESPEVLRSYQIALSKLVNSLSWGFEVIQPIPIDEQETIFYIDLRNYEWDVRGDTWTRIESVYPYSIEFEALTQSDLLKKLTQLREEMNCEVPFVHVDWFLATASLPPLYYDILDLPKTDHELERELGLEVARNIQSAPGERVWRAGFNDSGVSNNNRVVERHMSPHGAYWKSYDFATSVGSQNIFIHPLDFTHDSSEIIFNLPNGLQAYYLSDAWGNRLGAVHLNIVFHPFTIDTIVRTAPSCMGCHTEGMKDFEDQVRGIVEQIPNPSFDKEQVLRLYPEKATMDAFIDKDTERYRQALEATGDVFGGIEPIRRFYEVFQGPLDAAHAAAAVGLKTSAFLQKIREQSSLQNLGLAGLLDGGNVTRDAWTKIFATVTGAEEIPERLPCCARPPSVVDVSIPDTSLRAVIADTLGKPPSATITPADMARLTRIVADEKGISDLTGLEHATRLERIELRYNSISDLSPLAGLTRLNNIKLRGNKVTDVSPLAGLIRMNWLGLEENAITDLSPLRGLIILKGIGISGNPISDVEPLAKLISLEGIAAWNTAISDFSPLAGSPRLRWIEFGNDKGIDTLPSLKGLKALRRLDIRGCSISDISGLAELTQLEELNLANNLILDVSPLAGMTNLTYLDLSRNLILDVSPLSELTGLKGLYLYENTISDVSPLSGLSNLKTLELHNNTIIDFSPLDGLSENIVITQNDNPGVPVVGDRTARPATDVNKDGVTNILDLVLIAQDFGKSASPGSRADVNGDGTVNILDLIIVAQYLGGAIASAAPSILAIDGIEGLDPAVVQSWIDRAAVENDGSAAFQQGIATLQRLLVLLIPKKTVLLPNYPNPFNPETWIPYRLATDSTVKISIYDIKGVEVRALYIGYQRAGFYTDQQRAAYWDGRNRVGEKVASGVYFYHLFTNDRSFVRKMVIFK